MKRHILPLVLLSLAVASLACSLTVPIPPSDIKVGPTETRDLRIEPVGAPGDTAQVELGMGAGELVLRPGAGDALISGTATFNISDFEPQVEIDGTRVAVNQGDLQLVGIPDLRGEEIINRWDLRLGKQPIALRVNAGAYKADLDLGGISLVGLNVSDGAASVQLTFSTPNPVSMDTLRYTTGASNVRLDGLGNANFSDMRFEAGAGNYILDFGGELRQDAEVRIDTGLSSLRIIVPKGVPARAEVRGELSEVKAEGEWTGSGTAFAHPGEGSMLTIIINSSLGSVRLETD
ncbi:MAG: toast rack family protein [Anaerolineales bacterium]|nr:toast rack family protein [Anaerolineales bacterium]